MTASIESLTQSVLEQMSGTPSPRLREVMQSAVRHLHAFAQEVGLTPEEWIAGVSFLTATGKMCSVDRQEFILLSDTLGLSSLVNLLHDQNGVEQATESSVLGPFYRENSPEYLPGESIARSQENGSAVQYYGQITDTQGNPIPFAKVQIWQTDADGWYDIQLHSQAVMDMRGSFTCDAQGKYWATSVLPKSYPLPGDGPVRGMLNAQRRHGYRPAHIHFLISAEGYSELVTALYLAGDPYLETDTVFGVTSQNLVVAPHIDDHAPDVTIPAIRYDFRLTQGTSDSARVGADVSKLSLR